MVARVILCLAWVATVPLAVLAQEPAPQLRAFPVSKIQALDRPGKNDAGGPEFGALFGVPNASGYHVIYQIKGKNILAMNGVELESLVGPDGKNRAAEWNKEQQNKLAQPGALMVHVHERGPGTQFTISIPEGEFGKLDQYKWKGTARVLVGVEIAKATAEVWNNGTETKTDPGFTLKLQDPGKGIPAFQPGQLGLPGLLNPDILNMGLMDNANEAPFTNLIVSGPVANIRTIREKRKRLMGQGQMTVNEKETQLMIPTSGDAKRTFVIEYWKETREVKVPFFQ